MVGSIGIRNARQVFLANGLEALMTNQKSQLEIAEISDAELENISAGVRVSADGAAAVDPSGVSGSAAASVAGVADAGGEVSGGVRGVSGTASLG
jgi:hypothetical protein